ncbi:MAG: MoaD/ThiS family protein [Candidatus Hydrogenedentes bacterium]|nr:MoaD/ThiS family protein [Candidatus Hydrogenedentota bacterium]
MKQINIHYYALLREQRGCGDETIGTTAATAADLYHELRERHRFTLGIELLKVVVNAQIRTWNTILNDGDTVVFLPPVAGG